MTHDPILADADLRAMLVRRAGPATPPLELVQAIDRALAEAPEEARPWWSRLQPPAGASPALRLAWLAALVGLLAAAVVGAAMVGSAIFNRSDDLAVVVPLPSVTPSPEVADQTAAPVVTSSAFGPITWHRIDEHDMADAWDGFGTPLDVVGTPFGLVAMADDGLRWQAPDGSWQVTPLDGSSVFTDVSAVGDDLLVGGLWLRRSGSTWVVGERIGIEHQGLLSIDHVAAGPRGTVVTDHDAVYYAADGIHFAPATLPPDSSNLSGLVAGCIPLAGRHLPADWELDPVIATDAGFVAFSPSAPADASSSTSCGPVAWFSADGSTWDLVSPVSPFGAGHEVIEVASRGDRHVAIGRTAGTDEPSPMLVWVSDDGLTWDREPDLPLTGPCPSGGSCGDMPSRVEAGEPGWVILSGDGIAWTSNDGRTWQQLIGWPAIRGGWVPQDLALTPASLYVAHPAYPEDGIFIGTFEP